MKSHNSPTKYIALFAFFLLLAVAIRLLLPFIPDSEFILYRFAEHFKQGDGLIYGTLPPPITTYPVAPLLLTLHQTAIIIVATAIGGILLIYILDGQWHIGLVYVLLLSVHSATVSGVLLAFALGAVAAAKRTMWWLAGILMAAALLTDSTAVIPAFLLLMLALKRPYIWHYVLPTVLIPLILFALTRMSDAQLISFVPGFATVLVPLLAGFSLIRYRNRFMVQPYGAILVGWSAGLIVLAVFRQSLPGAAILPGLLALIALLPFSWIGLIAGLVEAVWLMGYIPSLPQFDKRIPINVIDKPAEQVVGEWLNMNISAQDILATQEIGALAYYADRTILDLSGRLQPVDFDKTFFLRYAPAVVVLEPEQAVAWEPFKTTYANTFAAGKYNVYQRVVRFAALEEHSIDLPLTANLRLTDLRLRGVAIGNQLQLGDLVRVRLDWELVHIPAFDIELQLKLLDAEGKALTVANDTLPVADLNKGQFSTYHLLSLPNETAEGSLTLTLMAGIHRGSFGEQKIVEVTVAK